MDCWWGPEGRGTYRDTAGGLRQVRLHEPPCEGEIRPVTKPCPRCKTVDYYCEKHFNAHASSGGDTHSVNFGGANIPHPTWEDQDAGWWSQPIE